MLCLGLGFVHHIILLMMWSRYQWHPMSIARKPWLSVDQRASQLEAWCCMTEWAPRYLSVIRSDKSQSRFVPTQQTLSEIPVMHLYSHPVTLWRLIHPRHSYGIRELHDLMVEGRDTWHWQSSSKTNYTIFYAMLRIGFCPSHHSPNDVIPLSMTSNVHSQETMTICWSTS